MENIDEVADDRRILAHAAKGGDGHADPSFGQLLKEHCAIGSGTSYIRRKETSRYKHPHSELIMPHLGDLVENFFLHTCGDKIPVILFHELSRILFYSLSHISIFFVCLDRMCDTNRIFRLYRSSCWLFPGILLRIK